MDVPAPDIVAHQASRVVTYPLFDTQYASIDLYAHIL